MSPTKEQNFIKYLPHEEKPTETLFLSEKSKIILSVGQKITITKTGLVDIKGPVKINPLNSSSETTSRDHLKNYPLDLPTEIECLDRKFFYFGDIPPNAPKKVAISVGPNTTIKLPENSILYFDKNKNGVIIPSSPIKTKIKAF